MIEDQLGRCVASWYPGATGVTGAAKLSGGASQETWTFDIVHPGGTVGAILRRAPPGYGASPGRAAGLDAEATLMQLAHDAGLHPTYISLLERGKRAATIVVVEKLAAALGVKMTDLIQPLEEQGGGGLAHPKPKKKT